MGTSSQDNCFVCHPLPVSQEPFIFRGYQRTIKVTAEKDKGLLSKLVETTLSAETDTQQLATLNVLFCSSVGAHKTLQ